MSIIKKYQPAKNNCKVTFTYPALEGVQSVRLLGDFNNWDLEKASVLKKSKNEFTANLELTAGKSYEFRYYVNDSQWENDFSADKYVSSPFAGVENSVIILDDVTPAKASKPAARKTTPATAESKTAAAKTPAKKPAAAVKTAPKAAAKTVSEVKTTPKTKTTRAKTTTATAAKTTKAENKK